MMLRTLFLLAWPIYMIQTSNNPIGISFTAVFGSKHNISQSDQQQSNNDSQHTNPHVLLYNTTKERNWEKRCKNDYCPWKESKSCFNFYTLEETKSEYSRVVKQMFTATECLDTFVTHLVWLIKLF